MSAIGRDWSDLPCEIVEEIILKIDLLEDVVRLSCVCRAWFTAFTRIRHMWAPASPWLLLPENTHDNPECVRKAYDTGNNKYYHLKLPQTFGRNCWGSEYGWIVTFGFDLKINLFNPLTKLQICLPSIDTLYQELVSLRYVCNGYCKYYRHWMRHFHIVKACVLKTGKTTCFCSDDHDDLGKDNGLFVAIIHNDYDTNNYNSMTHLSIAGPRDTRWTLIETPKDIHITDVTYCKDLLWVIDDNCSLWHVDLYTEGPTLKAVEFILNPQIIVDGKIFTNIQPITYLVKSFDHELLLIMRFGTKTVYGTHTEKFGLDGNYCEVHYLPENYWKLKVSSTNKFLMYKLDLRCRRWSSVTTSELDAGAIFLGKNTSMVSNGKKCKSGCIYFTGDSIIRSGHDMGIYHLDSKIIESICGGGDINSSFCNPFWFTPLSF